MEHNQPQAAPVKMGLGHMKVLSVFVSLRGLILRPKQSFKKIASQEALAMTQTRKPYP